MNVLDYMPWVSILISTVLPMLTALVTSKVAHSGLKAVTLALLAAVTGFVSEWYNAATANSDYNIGAGLAMAVTAFLVAVGTHYGLLKPIGVTGAHGGLQRAVPGGVGGRPSA